MCLLVSPTSTCFRIGAEALSQFPFANLQLATPCSGLCFSKKNQQQQQHRPVAPGKIAVVVVADKAKNEDGGPAGQEGGQQARRHRQGRWRLTRMRPRPRRARRRRRRWRRSGRRTHEEAAKQLPVRTPSCTKEEVDARREGAAGTGGGASSAPTAGSGGGDRARQHAARRRGRWCLCRRGSRPGRAPSPAAGRVREEEVRVFQIELCREGGGGGGEREFCLRADGRATRKAEQSVNHRHRSGATPWPSSTNENSLLGNNTNNAKPQLKKSTENAVSVTKGRRQRAPRSTRSVSIVAESLRPQPEARRGHSVAASVPRLGPDPRLLEDIQS
ncbi:hypothetical protein ACP4OV_017383 [Aristida adscensionis]